MRFGTRKLAVVVLLILLAAGLGLWAASRPQGVCRGQARCFTATVTRIVDGDTLDVGGQSIRLALVDTPERGALGYQEASDFTAARCPVGSAATVDEDDGQTQGSYGRILAKVTCGGVLLNAELVGNGHAVVLSRFCGVSEFADEPWTGC